LQLRSQIQSQQFDSFEKSAKIIILAVYVVLIGCGGDEGDEFEFIAMFGCEIQLWWWLRIEMMKVGGVVAGLVGGGDGRRK